MPNWCYNNVTLTHDEPAMIDRAISGFQNDTLANEFVPLPESEKDNWYDWCVSNWGTKWDFGGKEYDREDDNTVKFSFDTAWSPPVEFFRQLEELGFTVRAMYYEPGMAFCGIYEDGFDDNYELGGMDSDEVENTIPQELDEEFAISEQMADWESEQEYDEEDQENLDIDLDDGLSAINEGHENE